MKRPEPRALLAAISLGGLQLALFCTLMPLAPSDAHADSASLGKKGELAPLIHPDSLAAIAATQAAAEPPRADEPGTVPADELRDDILVLLAELPTPEAQAAVVTPDVPDIDAVVTEAPAEPTPVEAPEDEPDMVDLVLPSKVMGGY